MKTLTIIITALLILTGCPMTNKQVFEARKECHDAGMAAVYHQGGLTTGVLDVYCIPILNCKKGYFGFRSCDFKEAKK